MATSEGCALFFEPPPTCQSDAGEDDASDEGTIVINTTFAMGLCAVPDPISIGPNNGGIVTLGATVEGGPTQDGDVLTYDWTAPSGSFSDPGSLDTLFMCTAPGAVTVTFTVSSGPGCSTQASGTVTCE